MTQKPYIVLVALATFWLSRVHGHAEMTWPYPLRSKFDPTTPEALKDYSNTSPLLADGSNFPCKGYHKTGQAHATATYVPGKTYNITIQGTNHGGGSCQISLSTDKGLSFHVIKSIIGGCPSSATASYNFSMPDFAPAGPALLAWTWFNYEGNREMYMNCAEVNVAGTKPSAEPTQWPPIWIANLSQINNCTTLSVSQEQTVPVFPDPGSQVQYGGEGPEVESKGLKSASSPPSPKHCEQVQPGHVVSSSASGRDPIISFNTGTASPPPSPKPSSLSSYITPSPSFESSGQTLTLTASKLSSTANATIRIPTIPTSSSTSFVTVAYQTASTSQSPSPIVQMQTSAYLTNAQVSQDPLRTLSPSASSSVKPGDPCTPDNLVCISSNLYMSCDTSGAYGVVTSVSSGLACIKGDTNDRVVVANNMGLCKVSHSIMCLRDGQGFAVCDGSTWIDMGSVANGTMCCKDRIINRQNRSKEIHY